MASATRRGLIGLSSFAERVLRRAVLLWTFIVLVTFAIMVVVVGFPRDPEGDATLSSVEQPLQLGLLAVAVVGWLLAWRWPAAGAVFFALVGFGLGALSAIAYPPYVSFLLVGAFLAPAVVFWVLWQHARGFAAIAALAGGTAALLIAGWVGASAAYTEFFGPTHPASSTPEVEVDAVEWVWSGGVTSTSFRVTARADDAEGEPAELRVHLVDEPETTVGQVVPSRTGVPAGGVITWEVGDLEPDREYGYTVVIGGELDRGRGHGVARTFPAGPASFTVAFGACARTGSDGAVFDTIGEHDPLLYVNLGDLHYGNIDSDDVDAFRARYHDVLTSPSQAALYRSVPVAYVWDDHDYGDNDSDAGSPSRSAARLAYRENVPHYPLAAGDGDAAINQAFTAGRVRFVLTDVRSERAGDSMLGADQLRWLKDELATASREHALVVWVNPVPWITPAADGRDDWGGFADERRNIATFIDDAQIDNLVMVSGDAHMVAIDDGTNSAFGTAERGFPLLHAAALDRRGSVKGGPYSHGAVGGGGQFATMTVHDDGGDRVTVELSGWDWTGNELMSYTVEMP